MVNSLVEWDIVGRVSHSVVDWGMEQLLGRLGKLPVAHVSADFPILRKEENKFIATESHARLAEWG